MEKVMFENFVRDKCNIALVIAVLRSKPESMTTEEFVMQLQNNLNQTNNMDDDDETICSIDFNVDDGDVSMDIDEIECSIQPNDKYIYEEVQKKQENTILGNMSASNSKTQNAILDQRDKMHTTIDKIHTTESLLHISEKSNHIFTCPRDQLCIIPETPLCDTQSQITSQLTKSNLKKCSAYDNLALTSLDLQIHHQNLQEIPSSSQALPIMSGTTDNTMSQSCLSVDVESQKFIDLDETYVEGFSPVHKDDVSSFRSNNLQHKNDDALQNFERIVNGTQLTLNSNSNKRKAILVPDESEKSEKRIIKSFGSKISKSLSFLNSEAFNDICELSTTKLSNDNLEKIEEVKQYDTGVTIVELPTNNDNRADISETDYNQSPKGNEFVESQGDSFTESDEEYSISDFMQSLEKQLIKSKNQSHEHVCSQSQPISFKVIQEMNRVKRFLDKIESRGCSQNSQGSIASSCTKLEGWLSQAGVCLLQHVATGELSSPGSAQVALVLSRLVTYLDNGHLYPDFLNQLLEEVEKAIKTLFEDGADWEQRETSIQRLILLNYSSNVLTFTMETLLANFEMLLPSIGQKRTLFDKDFQYRNVVYILNIFEELIPMFLEKKPSLTQSTDDEGFSSLKSTISNFWDRKWSQKENGKEKKFFDVSFDTDNKILKRLSIVFTSLVTDCTEIWPLISFSALNCLSMIQKAMTCS